VIIQPTEALTVIDVNSGSFTRSANARETVLWTNCEAAREIARQLKLRNIGGVVIIDFIDMESRRDQLQLLEHFTQAVRNDSARPQIAQLTELGLVELTRKRQGQNIYELFGRTCPSCGGLGHVAVLPGKDTLQPLASLPGVVRTVPSSARPEAPVAPSEAAGSRRRRGGRGGRGSEGAEVPVVASNNGAGLQGEGPETPRPELETGGRRQELEFVAVPMDANQEEVYGWMGFNPALLLDPLPSGDNLVMRVVRPGCDPEAVLEEARLQSSASGSRRRRRGRGGDGRSTAAEVSSMAQDLAPDLEEAEMEPIPLPVATPAEVVTVVVPAHRRGSSRPAQTADQAVADPGGEGGEDQAGEPRRRRRRSSATV
jgi:ribonuclease E